MKRRHFLILSSSLVPCIALSAFPAAAHDYTLGNLRIDRLWARATPPTAPAGGGFLTVTNTGTTPDRLVSASSPASSQVQIHEMKMDGNIMRMRELDNGLEIPPGATVALVPGGFHLMMMGLKSPLKEGTRVPVTLVFEKAGKLDVELAVTAIGGSPDERKH
ncbi:copper chaperone PCu(A)C [Reyranella sp.]|uniref:copper chaperone PCu(A)C n=1 Tax=Reyranella sp. TaxID=1929291 RepID=UPI003D0E9828